METIQYKWNTTQCNLRKYTIQMKNHTISLEIIRYKRKIIQMEKNKYCNVWHAIKKVLLFFVKTKTTFLSPNYSWDEICLDWLIYTLPSNENVKFYLNHSVVQIDSFNHDQVQVGQWYLAQDIRLPGSNYLVSVMGRRKIEPASRAFKWE